MGPRRRDLEKRLRRLDALPVPAWSAALALYSAIGMLVWLPLGVRTNGLVEEWDLMWLLDRGEQLWWITSHSALSAFRLRPLTAVPYASAHALGNGFVWLNLLIMAVFAVKGLATFLLVDRLAPRRRAAAAVAGALAMLYPASTGLFMLRLIHIQVAVVFFLLALVLLCDVALTGRLWRVPLMFVLLAASLLTYQIATAATIVGPLALAIVGVRDRRRLIALSAWWFSALGAVAVYWFVAGRSGGTYEFSSTKVAPRPSPRQYGHDLIQSYSDQLFSAWRPRSWVTWEPRYIALGIGCGLLTSVAVLLARGSSRLAIPTSLLGGLAFVLVAPLGFLPLWAITAAIHEKLKVYLLSSVAVASGLALVLGFVCRRRAVLAAVAGVVVSLAAVFALHQRAYYDRLADAETRVLGEMVQQLPSPADGTTLVVRDNSGQLSLVGTLGPPVTFAAAVAVAFDNPTLRVVLCDELRRHAYLNGNPVRACPDRGHSTIGVSASRSAIFDYDLVSEMRLLAPSSPRAPPSYDPSRLLRRGRRSREALFACRPIQACTSPPSAAWPRGAIHEAFDSDSTNLTGFRPSERSTSGEAFRWSDSRVTRAYAFLPPRASRLVLDVVYVIDPAVLGSVRLRVNRHAVRLAVRPAGGRYRLTATVPADFLRPSPDDLEFTSEVVPVAGSPDPLGLAVSRLDVTPRG